LHKNNLDIFKHLLRNDKGKYFSSRIGRALKIVNSEYLCFYRRVYNKKTGLSAKPAFLIYRR